MRIGIRRAIFTIVLCCLAAFGQAGAPANSAPNNSVSPEDTGKIIQFLSSAVSWYRQRAVEQKLATEPSDLAFLQENARVADQVVQQAFDYARSEEQLQSRRRAAQPATQAQQSENTSQAQRLNQALQNVEQQIQDTQSELQTNREQLARATPAKRRQLQSQVDELQSELGLLNARHDALETMAEFVSTSGSGNRLGLRAQIEELARSVPPTLSGVGGSNSGAGTATTSSTPAVAAKPQPSGIWGLSTDLIHLSGKIHSIDDELLLTQDLGKAADSLRAPLVGDLQNLIHQGDQLSAAADNAGSDALAQQTQQLDALTAQFKQVTTTLLPLSKVGVLLGVYESTLKNWRDSVRDEEHEELRQLLFRLGIFAVMVGLVFLVGEIWRRASLRYVHDVRRRYQILLLRRILIWVAVVIIVILTFASQLGSAVTFAGLITAGIAVAMQNVITSIVGYFFLIGKYGLRVGDRVQIAGVTGEVVDIGLVRIHLMELGGPADSQPTGRIVAFSNSIVFQSGPGIFKQIPGTNFIWHELKLTLASETNYHQAKERILQAVDSALGNYRENIAAQSRLLERSLTTVSPTELQPKVRLHYTATGIEAVVRFPVEIGKAAEIDDHMMRELLTAFDREPKMKVISAEIPSAKAAD
ncbi:MAG TPA: mechanosensitive ion channel domain-containing protein [Terriglobales bacterium]|nr:mechanosensitive ion channel domain-containing protein [Terriglobales bacterium]